MVGEIPIWLLVGILTLKKGRKRVEWYWES
jgi:hypothetical protein